MRLRLLTLTALLLALVAGASLADVLELKDGRKIEGEIVKEGAGVVRIKTRFGELEFKRSEIDKITRGKTRDQEFEERWDAAQTADDFHELGVWADDKRMRSKARKCMERAIELDPDHADAHKWLGHVPYKGRWVTPEEREALQKEDQAADMREKGLVLYGDRWVTPEEREKLEQGLVLVDGRWLPFEEAQRAKGLAEYEGRWLPEPEALARQDVSAVAAVAHERFEVVVTADAILAGDVDAERLEHIGTALTRGREWFDDLYGVEPGLALFGNRLAELYVFSASSDPYVDSVEHFAGLTTTVPAGWADAVKRTHGFIWWDPYPVSSARRWKRNEQDLDGHCYHHWGHLLLNRLGYDGRLLPPWYDEGFAALMEYRSHGRNAVVCRASTSVGRGTSAKGATFDFDPKDLREGAWREVLQEAMRANRVRSFDKLAALQFSELELLDVATGMAILEWLESQERGTLARFHAELRKAAPAAPVRVIDVARDRQAVYDAAFGAAVKLRWREADRSWREWFLTR